MDDLQKLKLSKHHVECLEILLCDNEWSHYLNSSLISIKYELDRQISLLENANGNV